VRAAIARLTPELHLPLGAKLSSDALVTIDQGEVTVTSQATYGDSVLTGRELAVLVVERVAALAEERKVTPPSDTQLAEEASQLASLRKKTGPLWTRLPLPLKVALVIAAALVAAWGFLAGELPSAGSLPQKRRRFHA
jgi:hypothetical protein